MNLRRAALFAAVGSVYTVLHKLAYGLVPALGASRVGEVVASVLSLVAALTMVLFAFEFLRELTPRDRRLRYSLVSVIVFTGVVMVLGLPLPALSSDGISQRLVFGVARLLNSLAVLAFLVSLTRLVVRNSPLWVPLRGSIWACGAMAALGLVSTGYLLTYALTGLEVEPLRFLQPLAVVVFLFAYGLTTWFLIRFWRMGSYREFANR